MLLHLDPDQQLFRETTARFLDEAASPEQVRRLRDDPAGFDPQYWQRGAELGWTSLLVGEDAGGGSISDAGLVDLTLVAHEFGTHAAPGPLAGVNVVAAALARHEPGSTLLADVLAGTAVASWAHGEPVPNDRLGAVGCSIHVDGDELVLNGTKRPVEAVDQASHLLVTARADEGLTQVLVPTDLPGITSTPLRSVDLTRRFWSVRFDDVRVPTGAALGEVGGAAADVERQLQHALVIATAEMVGTIQRAFDLTLEWAFDRYSFGRPLASYQALKHRFADMACWLQSSHAIGDAAGRAVDEGRSDAATLVSAALVYVGDHGSELLQECIQLHGGIGVTFEHDLHLFLRRHTLDRTLHGTPAEHRQRLTSLVEAAMAA